MLLEDIGLIVHWADGCTGGGERTLGQEDTAQQVPFTAVQGTVPASQTCDEPPKQPLMTTTSHGTGEKAAF